MPERGAGGFTHDVAVIGGGPGGSTAATLVAAAGRSVVLFEKERFPRFHIGESLLPFNVDLLRRLGVLESVERCFVEKWGVQLYSSDGAVTRRIVFEDGLVAGYPRSFQVLRSRFDELLLRNAAAHGAEVLEQHAVIDARPSHRDGCEIVARRPDGAVRTCRVRFVLDASGRDAFLASRHQLRAMMTYLRKAAVFAHYTGVPRAAGRAAGDIVLVLLRDGWFWMIPLPDGITSVGLVTDGTRIKSCGLPPAELLERSLRCCPAARERMRDARRVSEVYAASDYSYECAAIAGDGYLLVGDAAAFIDPVFSTGVWLAMSSAELAADAVVRGLAHDDGSGRGLAPASFAAYERRVRHHVRTYLRLVRRFYEPGFLDLFLQSETRYGIREAVISLLAGMADPPLAMRARIACFYAATRLQRSMRLAPPLALLRVLEEAAS